MSSRSSDVGVLCCCEYENSSGERSHILACCCDCQALDEAVDRCITCKRIPDSTMQQVITTLVDRCRFPGCTGKGAIKLRADVIFPVVMVPMCLLISTLGMWATVAMLTFMPLFMIGFYQVWKRTGHRQTMFFYIWGLTSVILSFFIFLIFVVSFREILLWEILLLTSAVGLMFHYVGKVRRNPGRLKRQVQRFRETRSKHIPNGDLNHGSADVTIKMNGNGPSVYNDGGLFLPGVDESGLTAEKVTWVDSRPIKNGELELHCGDCNNRRPPRSGHCTVCNTCIPVRDHHCVWVDSCIGAKNHRSFLAAMFLFLFCGFYGSHLTLTTVCTPEMYMDWLLVPSDCRFLYADFQTALCFVSVCYTLVSTSIMTVGFLHQLVLISQNLTSQELHQAASRGMTRMGLFAINNINNHGVLRNWVEFLFTDGRKALPAIPS